MKTEIFEEKAKHRNKIDDTLKKLEKSEKSIRKLNADLEERVKARTMQLEASNKELEAFSYSISHDLRAPLRHIEGFTVLLQKERDNKLTVKSRHFVENIIDAVNKMGIFIDDLLAFSRMNKIKFNSSPVFLSHIVKEAQKEIYQDIKDRNIIWKIHELPKVKGDSSLLGHVMINLISNAVKFTSSRKKARIEIGSIPGKKNEIVIFVKDNGVGFNMKYADKLFGVFQRLHSSEEFEGTGIGLAIVRRIILRHGGKVWAEGSVGRGAEFYFSLPIN